MPKRPHFAAAIDAKKEEPKEAVSNKASKPAIPEKQPSRVGQVTIVTYTSKEVKKQLKILALENDTTQTELFREALNLLFKKHKKSLIA